MYALDIETTGFSPANDRIIEISIMEFSATNISSCESWLINPQRTIPASASKIHGITDDLVKDSPAFPRIALEISKIPSNCTVVAHNAQFDWQFILAEYKRAQIPPPQVKVIDSIRLAKAAFPGLPSYSLSKLCKQLEINVTPTHRAESDTKALVMLVQKCIAVIGTGQPASTLDKFARSRISEPERDKASP